MVNLITTAIDVVEYTWGTANKYVFKPIKQNAGKIGIAIIVIAISARYFKRISLKETFGYASVGSAFCAYSEARRLAEGCQQLIQEIQNLQTTQKKLEKTAEKLEIQIAEITAERQSLGNEVKELKNERIELFENNIKLGTKIVELENSSTGIKLRSMELSKLHKEIESETLKLHKVRKMIEDEVIGAADQLGKIQATANSQLKQIETILKSILNFKDKDLDLKTKEEFLKAYLEQIRILFERVNLNAKISHDLKDRALPAIVIGQ